MSKNGDTNFWMEFLEMYKSHPQLWNPDSEDYRNKYKRMEAEKQLLDKFREIDSNATIAVVKNKINIYRASYRRELAKVRQGKKLDANGHPFSSWKYFKSLSFLENIDGFLNDTKKDTEHTDASSTPNNLKRKRKVKERLKKKRSKDTTTEDDASDSAVMDPFDMVHEDVLIDKNDIKAEDPNSYLEAVIEEPMHPGPVDVQKNLYDSAGLVHPPLEQAPEFNELVKVLCRQLRNSSKEYDIYGRAWTMQYRALSGDQQLLAKKAIDEILFEARLGNLRKNSVKINDGLCSKCVQHKDVCNEKVAINADKLHNLSLENELLAIEDKKFDVH